MLLVIALICGFLSGCAVAHWSRGEDGRMHLQEVMISTGPAKSKEGDVEMKAPLPDLQLPGP